MAAESRIKTFGMVLGLAAFVGMGAACFSLFKSDPKPTQGACSELEGQAHAECERRRER